MYKIDEKNNFTTDDYVTTKMLPELNEIINKYKVCKVMNTTDNRLGLV